MRSDEQRYKTIGLMIFTVIIIFSVVGIVIIGFKMVKKNEEAKLVAAADTEYMKKQKQDIESQEGSQEEKSTEESLNIEEFLDSATDSDKNTNAAADSDSDTEVSEADARVYLIQGNEKSSNRYEKADHLSYTTVTKYTLQDLSILDSYGLKITRNEIFARHGRMFNDQELQEYFKRQQWYVPQIAANDFDTSCLNEVEKYNVNLISVYEEDGHIKIDAADNGLGMTEEKLEYIMHKQVVSSKRGSGIGVRNVNERIQLIYGKQYGITISSELDEGTTATIIIPKMEETDETE